MEKREGQAHCGKCKTYKALDEFAPSQRHNGGWCRSCHKAQYRAERPALPSAKCQTCEQVIEEPKPRQQFCSPACKMKARYWRLNPKQARTCRVCGVDITDKRANAQYCSGRCTERARRSDGRVTSEMRRASRLQSEYGITAEDYERMLVAQDGGCAICGSDNAEGRGGMLHVDHCHSTGKVRGLLCDQCNHGLGKFKDDQALLQRAIEYLEGRS